MSYTQANAPFNDHFRFRQFDPNSLKTGNVWAVVAALISWPYTFLAPEACRCNRFSQYLMRTTLIYCFSNVSTLIVMFCVIFQLASSVQINLHSFDNPTWSIRYEIIELHGSIKCVGYGNSLLIRHASATFGGSLCNINTALWLVSRHKAAQTHTETCFPASIGLVIHRLS